MEWNQTSTVWESWHVSWSVAECRSRTCRPLWYCRSSRVPSVSNATMITEHSLPVSSSSSSSSDAASEAAGFSLLSPRRPPLPARRHGGAQGVSLRCGFWDRRECCDWKFDWYCHCGETSKPRPQKPLGHTAQPGPTVPAAAAWAQVEIARPFANTRHYQSSEWTDQAFRRISTCLGSERFCKGFSDHQDCIYLVKNTVKTVKLWNRFLL